MKSSMSDARLPVPSQVCRAAEGTDGNAAGKGKLEEEAGRFGIIASNLSCLKLKYNVNV